MTKRVTNQVVFVRIGRELDKYPYGISRCKVAQNLDLKVSTLGYHWSKLIKLGWIKNIGYGCFVKDNNSWGGVTKSLINVHALQLSFPILRDESNREFWDKEVKRNNTSAFYKKVNIPIGLTIQKDSKTITIQVWSRDVKQPEDIENLALRSAIYVHSYLKDHGVLVDIMQVERKSIDISIEDENLKKVIPKGDKIEVNLSRDTKSLFEADHPKEAKAWTDSSPIRCVETNDIEYAKNYLRTPEMVREIVEIQRSFAENLKSHLAAIQELRDAVKELRDTMKEK